MLDRGRRRGSAHRPRRGVALVVATLLASILTVMAAGPSAATSGNPALLGGTASDDSGAQVEGVEVTVFEAVNYYTRGLFLGATETDKAGEFTFVVDGVEKNCTWWSYEMQPTEAGTRLTERWWVVNKTPAIQAATDEQIEQRVAFTQSMLNDTVAAIKRVAEG